MHSGGKGNYPISRHDLFASLIGSVCFYSHAVFTVLIEEFVSYNTFQPHYIREENKFAEFTEAFLEPTLISNKIREQMNLPSVSLKTYIVLIGQALSPCSFPVVVDSIDGFQTMTGRIPE